MDRQWFAILIGLGLVINGVAMLFYATYRPPGHVLIIVGVALAYEFRRK